MKIKLYSCGSERPESEIPLSIGYLMTNVKNADISFEKNRDNLKDCDYIGISATAHGIKEAIDILSTTNIPVIIGGQSTLWGDLEKYPFKHIVKGDGEKSLQDIIDGTENRILECYTTDLNTLNFPKRGSLREAKVPLFTSRGCPYDCAFCSSTEYWKKVRYVSAEYFINEVEHLLIEYGSSAKWLYIMDDLFIGNVKRFYEIYELWMKRGYNKRLQLWSFIRANMFNDDICIKMKEMGFKGVRFGAESGCDRILKLLNKKSTVEINQNAINIANKIGLPVYCSFMYDMPTETPQEKQMTLDFIKRNSGKMRVSGFYRFCSFPGTVFYNNQNPLIDNMSVR
jgi:radical SAM superfamily enzyme YgiQ (UPF0313 family)